MGDSEFRATVRRYFAERSPETEVRRLADHPDGYDPAAWRHMAELGYQGLLVPESLGGAEGTFEDLAVVMEEAGRALLCAPLLATAGFAVPALALTGGDFAAESLAAIARGELIATVAVTEPAGRWDLAAVETAARPNSSGYVLNGVKDFVLDGLVAQLILVAARTPRGVSLFAVKAGADGLTRHGHATLDPTRKLARLELRATPATLLGSVDGDEDLLARILDRAAVALAAEQGGGARRALEMMVDYAKVRVQFGRPIGSFQAIRHRCADAYVGVESAASIVESAACAAAADAAELPVLANVAKASATEVYTHVALENIQIHGGIGFSWEHPAQLYYKRSRSSAALLGDANHHRRLLAQRIEL